MVNYFSAGGTPPPTLPELYQVDLALQTPTQVVSFDDIQLTVLAFQGEPYPYGCPDDPCFDNEGDPAANCPP